ncbi:MAG: diaminopimelate decarboxylase [Acidobacteria bacterium OLB17]|nr:MAG: diaminopimelate decarboxylase [Acidobacteria bacterium OLB17]MCZ2389702.1 diaminopimelate decarboxylase [Acidobacteriota bacterium]
MSWQIEGFLETRNGHLTIDGVDAVELAKRFGSPLFVYSEARIRRNIERLKLVGDAIGCGFKLSYAAKAMSTLGILRAVKDADCDIEVNSGGELWKALKAGFNGSQINFNGTSKEAWEIDLAIENDIYAIQADSLFELSLIDEAARRLGKRANVSLRLVPEIASDTHSGLQTALLTSKFGMMPEEAYRAVAEFADSPYVNICGVHLHIGSQNPDPSVYVSAFETLFASLLRIFNETGQSLEHINLGGGFPVKYLAADSLVPDEKQRAMLAAVYEPADAIGPAWDAVRRAAKAADAEHLLDGITLLLEPGRSIIADAGVCLTTVRNAKSRPTDDGGEDHWILTDAGFNILLSMETYKWYYRLISAERADAPHDAPYKAAGPLCDGGDVYFDIEGEGRLPDHRLLPKGVEPGETLALLNCGAYSLAQASQYNARFLPAVVLIGRDGEPTLIRRRDTFKDLVSADL